MARARRKAPSPVVVLVDPTAQEQEEQEDDGGADEPSTQLNFDQSLTGRPGKPIAVAELLKRLRTLHTELLSLEQDEGLHAVVKPVAQQLVNANVFGHKDKGVKAWAGCCIVEVLRLTAPNAPFVPSQLKDFFDFVNTTVIPAFKDPNDPYSSQHAEILLSLDDVKSIAILPSMPASDSLVVKLFSSVFDLLGSQARSSAENSLSKKIEFNLTGMLITVVEESNTLPAEVIELILAQFLRIEYGLMSMRKKPISNESARGADSDVQYPHAYQVARTICNQAAVRMSRAVSQYFSSVIIDASESTFNKSASVPRTKKRRGHDDEESEDDKAPAGPSEEDMKELAKAHKLLTELWRSAPDAIQNVIPQLDAELSAENTDIRLLATVTIGDMVAGIGAAGLPSAPNMDPAAYPSQSSADGPAPKRSYNVLTKPASPQDFSRVHASAYGQFLRRQNDKSPHVRAAFVDAVGRILITQAGGIGLDRDAEAELLKTMSSMLQDTDERVRLAAVQFISKCTFEEVTNIFGQSGAVHESGSVLCALADRMKDKKLAVRSEAMKSIARLWAVASGAIVEGNQRIATLLGAIPSNILDVIYVNDKDINKLMPIVLFESLLPLSFPPVKGKDKVTDKVNGSQRVKDSQSSQGNTAAKVDIDAIRTERLLYLVKDLSPKAKNAFFAIQRRQVQTAAYVEAFIKGCEAYNGGITSDDSPDIPKAKSQLARVIEYFASQSSDMVTASEHLWKIAARQDRRSYSLLRFALSPESDYKKVVNAIKEFKKRWQIEDNGKYAAVCDTFMPLVYSSSVILYNRSNVPAILKYSRASTDELSATAHELLKQIGDNHPEVFKAHVRTMCSTLTHNAPSTGTVLDDGILQTLKACAGFAQKYPSEMPQDRDLLQALVKYALHGNPPKAAKYAVTVLVSNDDKRELYVKELVTRCIKGFKMSSPNALSILAALSQLTLLAAPDMDEEDRDSIVTIAISDVLMVKRTVADDVDDDVNWKADMDEYTEAKLWALKILVNPHRSFAENTSKDASQLKDLAKHCLDLLQMLISNEGTITESNESNHHRARMRLAAGIHILKLVAAHKAYDSMLEPATFNKLALLVQDTVSEVRAGFLVYLKKYLGQNLLPSRYYAHTFLLAFEPTSRTKEATMAWLRARAAAAAKTNDNAMELAFARFLSVLAHHSDFSTALEHREDWFSYVIFYLQGVATKDNISLIYAVAQKVKTVRDGIDDAKSEDLYYLSDIAQAVIREYAEAQGWQLNAYEGKISMPAGIFARMPRHSLGQEVSEKNFAGDKVLEDVDTYVRNALKSKKRKLDHEHEREKKKLKTNGFNTAKPRTIKTPKRRKGGDASSLDVPSAERRRSARQSTTMNYAGMDDSDEDEPMDGVEQRQVEADKEVEQVGDDGGDTNGDEGENAPSSENDTIVVAVTSKLIGAKKEKPSSKAKQKPKKLAVRPTRGSRSKKSVIEISDQEDEVEEDEEDEDEDMGED